MNATTHAQVAPAPPRSPRPRIPDQADRDRQSSSRLIGALFLVGFLVYGTGSLLTTSIVDADDVVGSVAAHQTTFALGAVLMLTVAVVDIGKAVLFFPLLGRSGRRTALTYLAGMTMEVTLMAVGALALLSVVPLGDQVQSGATSAGLGQSLGTLAVDVNDLAYQTGQATVGVAAFFLTLFLLRTAMVPRFLALWGVIGYALHFTGAAAELFGLHISMFLLIPGGLFELGFAGWLLVRGIARPADTPSVLPGSPPRAGDRAVKRIEAGRGGTR